MGNYQSSEERRLSIHAVLKSINNNCYYNPLENVKMVYPAIVYKEAEGDIHYANNNKYFTVEYYTITIISQNPVEASEILDKVLELPYTEKRASYIQSNLHHKIVILKTI